MTNQPQDGDGNHDQQPPPPPGFSQPGPPTNVFPQHINQPVAPVKRSKSKGCLFGLLGLFALGVVGCGALVAFAATTVDDDKSAVELLSDGEVPREDDAEQADSDHSDQAPEEDREQTVDAVSADPEPAEIVGGTREAPFAMDRSTTVVWDTFGDADDSVWNMTIGQLTEVNELVAETNQFNDPPPDGVVFAAFDVEMTLLDAGKVPLSKGFNFSWEVIGGSTAAVYDFTTLAFGCGVLPDGFGDDDEVFVGGTVSGTVCIPIPVKDLTDPATSVALGFGDRLYFSPNGESPAAERVPPVEADMVVTERNGTRSGPYAYGSPEAVEFETFGDADGSIWMTAVGEPRDLTAEVLAENQFNDAPMAGTLFAAFDVAMTLDSADVEPLSPLFNFNWEITGGASARVYDQFTLGTCGVVPDSFDIVDEVFVGGTVSGTVCLVIPTEDITHPNTRVTLHFAEDTRTYFG